MQANNEDRELITTMGQQLVTHGFPANIFTDAVFNAEGYFEKSFASLLRTLQSFTDERKLERVLMLGITGKFYETIRYCQPREFYNFLKYLRTPAGQNELGKMSMHEKLQKRGAGDFTAQQMGYIAMFDAQRGDLATRKADIRREQDAIIAELERQLKAARDDKDQLLAAASQEFLPAGSLPDQDVSDFNKACWDLYLDDCRQRNVQASLLTADSCKQAVLTYGQLVRNRRILEHLAAGRNQELLTSYVNQRIGHFRQHRDERTAKRFRTLLGAVGLEPTPQAAAGPQVGAGPANPGGEAGGGAPDEIFAVAVLDPNGGAPQDQEDREQQAPPHAQPPIREPVVQLGSTQVQPPPYALRHGPRSRAAGDTSR